MEAFEAATASGEPDAALFLGGQLFIVRYHQGRGGELADQFVQVAGLPESIPAWRSAAAICLLQGGRSGEARQLALAEDLATVPMDAVWTGAMCGWAEVSSDLGLVDRAEELYELLAPFAGQVASGGAQLYGPIAWQLGKLAATLGQYPRADEHFAAAAQIDERLCGPLFLARTNAAWADALIARGLPEDLDRVESKLEQAEGAAQQAGAAHIIAKVAECRVALAAVGSPDS
jgi:tetratricopeptide (TPR) repeat protein